MKPLGIKELEHLQTSLEDLKNTDPTYLFLKECTNLLQDQLLTRPSKICAQHYIDAVQVLCKHCEYLAYRLGIQDRDCTRNQLTGFKMTT